MKWWRRLTARLFVSYAAVAIAGAIVFVLTIRLLVPRLFDDRVGRGPAAGRGPSMHDALVASLDRALLVAIVVSLVVAALVAVAVARRIVEPIQRVRGATRRLAAGHYDEAVPVPAEAELAALADDVNSLARSLAHTEQRRAELVSDVAHELRTPLTTIRGYVEGMVDGVIEPETDVLASMLREVDRLQRLAGDLSTLSRADEGRLELAAATFDLDGAVAEVVAAFAAPAAARSVTLTRADASAVLAVTGDRDRIVQVLTNLVANALTYTPEGGHVRVATASDGADAIVSVADTGVGLTAADLDRVFERFYRVPGVARPPGGSGIGLAIAHAIAHAHGGSLTASSPGPGRGATFTLRLPRSARPS